MSVLKEMALCRASSFGERAKLKETAARSGRDIWTLRGAGATGVAGPAPDQVGGAEPQPRGPCWVGEPPPFPAPRVSKGAGWPRIGPFTRQFLFSVLTFQHLPLSCCPGAPLPHKLLPGLSPRSDSPARNREQPFFFFSRGALGHPSLSLPDSSAYPLCFLLPSSLFTLSFSTSLIALSGHAAPLLRSCPL